MYVEELKVNLKKLLRFKYAKMASQPSQNTNGLPSFEDISVSTKTFTAMTNLTIDLEKLFHAIPVVPYVIIPKKRGTKEEVRQIRP